jgi:sulfite reductase alpha subunit-like flavoprotein
MTSYAEISDIRAAGYPLSAAQEETAQTLLIQSSARLRLIARNVHKDIDALIADETAGADYALAVKSVIVQAVTRALDSASGSGQNGIVQGSQTLGAYTVQQTFFNPGQSLYFLRNELKELGLYRPQTYGAFELWASGGDSS